MEETKFALKNQITLPTPSIHINLSH